MPKYEKYHVSKHERDRQLIAEQQRILEHWMREIVWQRPYRLLETSYGLVETGKRTPLGNGCFRVRSLAVDY